MIPWDELEDIEPLKPEPIRKAKLTEQAIKRQVKLDEARHVAYRSCGRKRRYPDVARATHVAQKQRVKSGLPVTPYLCQVCDGFHLTSKPHR